MELKLFSIYDVKAEIFKPPFFAVNRPTAMRTVQSALSQDNELSRYPGDFKIYEMGTFDDKTGEIIPELPTSYVCEVQSLKPQEVDND